MKAKRRELDTLLRLNMPVVVGRMAKDHFQDNFRKGGFVNNGLQPWKPARRLSSGGQDAASNYGTLHSGRNHLFNSIKYTPEDYRVKIENKVFHAPVHNWGATIQRTDGMRAHAWKRFFEACGVTRDEPKESKREKTSPVALASNPTARFWKAMALTKKKSVKIPQRQFLGESAELSEIITTRIGNEIRKILNS